MIEFQRILEVWQKSNRIPELPNALHELIELSFQNRKDRIPSSVLLTYVQDNRDFLIPILETDLYQLPVKRYTARELLDIGKPEIIRNLLLINWMQKLDSCGSYERINYDHWHRQNLVTAFVARYLSQQLGISTPDDAFILSYLQDLSLLFLSRTVPEIYDVIALSDFKRRFNPEREFKTFGTNHGQLSSWILRKWRFSDFYVSPLQLHHADSPLDAPRGLPEDSKLFYISQMAARLLLAYETTIDYNQFERLFQQTFNQTPAELQKHIIEISRLITRIAPLFGFSDLSSLSVIRLLKENKNFLRKRLLSYEELLNETVNAQDQITILESELKLIKNQVNHWELHDPVTGLYNHTYLHEVLQQQVKESARYNYPVSLIILDVDEFRLFNSSYGYDTGNHILVQISRLLEQNVRKSDLICRFGGDEFAIILPHTGVPQSRFVGEKICKLISESEFTDSKKDRKHKISTSVGSATLSPSVTILQADRLIQTARSAVQVSRQKGGNTFTQVA